MRIGILVLMAGRNAGGPETYEVELIRSLANIDSVNEYFVYVTTPSAISAIGVSQANVKYRLLRPSLRPVSLTLTLPLMMKRDGIDFLHCTFTPPLLHTSKLVYTVHCLSSIVNPGWYKPAVALRLNYLLKQGIRRADVLACVSQYTADHVHELFGVDRSRLITAYNGVGKQFRVYDQEDVRERITPLVGQAPYILYLGKVQTQKNIVRLLQAYDEFRRSSKSDTKLVLAGRTQGETSGIENQLLSMQFGHDVVRLGYVPNELTPYLYAGARVFVYPSLWEGFGIPIVEAMASGVPVLTSNVTCLPEIAGGAAEVVDPTSVDQLATAMAMLDSSSEKRSTLREAGLRRAKVFSWDNCARSVVAGYGRMAI